MVHVSNFLCRNLACYNWSIWKNVLDVDTALIVGAEAEVIGLKILSLISLIMLEIFQVV